MARGGGDKEAGTLGTCTVGVFVSQWESRRPGGREAWLWRFQQPEAVPNRANQSEEVGGDWPIGVQNRTRKGAAEPLAVAVGAAGAGVRVAGRAKAAEAGKAASGERGATADSLQSSSEERW